MEEKLHLSSKKALPSFAQYCAHNKSWAVKYSGVQKKWTAKKAQKRFVNSRVCRKLLNRNGQKHIFYRITFYLIRDLSLSEIYPYDANGKGKMMVELNLLMIQYEDMRPYQVQVIPRIALICNGVSFRELMLPLSIRRCCLLSQLTFSLCPYMEEAWSDFTAACPQFNLYGHVEAEWVRLVM